jgi:nucleoside-diphosphate-sugar epimerase
MSSADLALVTGFPGWLGNRLVQFLHERHPDLPSNGAAPRFSRVRALVLPGTDTEALRRRHPELELAEGDIRDPAAVGRFCAGAEGATVFHLAGVIHPKRIGELYEINTEGTRHLLAAAAAAGTRQRASTSPRPTARTWDMGARRS